MNREQAIDLLDNLIGFVEDNHGSDYDEALKIAIKALKQEPSRDIKEIREVMSCDADAETKCKMISSILTTKSHYFKEDVLYRIRRTRYDIENEFKFWSDFSKCDIMSAASVIEVKAKEQSYKHCLELINKLIAEIAESEG